MNYSPVFIDGMYKRIRFKVTLKYPWVLECPDGRYYWEATYDDVIARMNIINQAVA